MSEQLDKPGRRLGEFRLLGVLARGGMGVVYLAEHLVLARRCALKVVAPDLRGDPNVLQRFMREARLASLVDDPHVVRVLHAGEEEGQVYLAMEHVFGCSVQQLLEAQPDRRLPGPAVIALGKQICTGLAAVHAAGLVHRDVKPANVLVSSEGRVVLGDFGLASLVLDPEAALVDLVAVESGESSEVPRRGRVFGTPGYMAPEQWRAEEDVDGRADLYGLGVSLYELLSGQLPVNADDRRQLGRKVVRGQRVPLVEVLPTVHPELAELVERCLATEPEDRPSAAAEVFRALTRLGERVGELPVIGLSELVETTSSRRETMAALPQASSSQTVEVGSSLSDLPSSAPDLLTPTNLPRRREPRAADFVGRGEELVQLSALLAEETTRLVTLRGAAGVGKTSLACALARQLLGRFRGGVWFADLSEARDRADVAQAVARAVDFALTEGDPVEQAGAALAGLCQNAAAPLLLLADNAERVSEPLAELLSAWLAAEAGIRVLVTSRQALGLAEEHVHVLAPMLLADSERLFVARAAQANPAFVADGASLPLIGEICRKLDGIPLALELAASRTRDHSLEALLRLLDEQRFEVLRQEVQEKGGSGRYRTLKAALSWSWEQLSPDERACLSQLSVFRGGFSPELVGAVVRLPEQRGDDSLEIEALLERLVASSLLEVRQLSGRLVRERRYSLLVSVRELAAERREEGESRPLAERFCEAVVARAEREVLAIEAGDPTALDRLQLEIDNLVHAQDLAVTVLERPLLAGRALAASYHVLYVRGPLYGLKERYQRALEASGVSLPPTKEPPAELDDDGLKQAAELLAQLSTIVPMGEAVELGQAAGAWASRLGGVLADQVDLARCYVLRRSGDAAAAAALALDLSERTAGSTQAKALLREGVARMALGEFDRARACLERSAQVYRELEHLAGVANAQSQLSFVFDQLGQIEAAAEAIEEAEVTLFELGAKSTLVSCWSQKANVRYKQGRFGEALAVIDDLEALISETGLKTTRLSVIGTRALIQLALGHFEAAIQTNREALAMSRELGSQYGISMGSGNLGHCLLRAGRPAEALEVLAEAEAISREQGARYPLGYWLASTGEALLELERAEEALVALKESRDLRQETGQTRVPEYVSLMTELARAHRALGDRAAAEELVTQAVALAQEMGLPSDSPADEERKFLRRLKELAQPGGHWSARLEPPLSPGDTAEWSAG